MFGTVRLIFGCILLGCSIVAIRKSKAVHKKIFYIVSVIISAVLATSLAFIPFENLFISFNSPTAAYEYINFGKTNIELVVEGDHSDFVVNRGNDSYGYLIIPKTEDGWKIGIGSDTKRIKHTFSNGFFINVYQYKDTSDYYIAVYDPDRVISNITDSCNSKFQPLEKNHNSLGTLFTTYFAHISDLDSQYCLVVNGNQIIP